MSWIEEAEAGLEVEAQLGKAINEAEEWKPEVGDVLIGTLRQVSAVVTKFGIAFKVYVETEDKSVVQVFGSASMFKEELVNNAPTVGRGIAIRFDGKGPKQYDKALWYVNSETIEADRPAARGVIYEAITQAEKLKAMKDAKTPEREPDPLHNGSAEEGELTAPF